jgi:DNA replication protein DnaC
MFVVEKKRGVIKQKLVKECIHCDTGCSICTKKLQFVDRMANANIPANYWFLKLSDFKGPVNLKDATTQYAQNLEKNYNEGKGMCFVGQYGTGKTYSICSLLKHALLHGYEAYYTSLNDMVHYMTDFSTNTEFYKMITKTDFLAIDEVDSRHFSDSDQAQQYFGSNFERIIRYRSQNGLPIFVASNNSSLEEVFTGQYKRVIDSLSAHAMQVVPVLGKDHRKI